MICDQCGKKHDRIRFCSNKCKDRWHNKNRATGFVDAPGIDAIEEMAGSDYAAGWDEDGWRDDDSGVG